VVRSHEMSRDAPLAAAFGQKEELPLGIIWAS